MDPNLAGLLQGLLAARWRSLCVCTGRYRWVALDRFMQQQTAREIHLEGLEKRHAIMLMDNLPQLKRQALKTKIWLLGKIGGHPHTLELLEGWLASGRVTDLLDNPALDALLATQWEAYFLADLLAELTPDQKAKLTRLAIFRTPLDEAAFTHADVDAATITRWLDLSLLQVERTGNALHTVHPRRTRLSPQSPRRHGPYRPPHLGRGLLGPHLCRNSPAGFRPIRPTGN